jgi:hypothetical protein
MSRTAKQFDSTAQLRAANNVLSARVGVATVQSQRDLSDARQLADELAVSALASWR